MKITLHQLKVFNTVAQQGSVTLAAQKLHMTQPAVSNIIKHLEEYYDCKLIETIRRKVSLTAYGKAVLSGCLLLEETLANIETELEILKGGLAGTLRVATVSTARYFIPRLLGEFKGKYNNIHIKLTVCNRQEIIERLEQNLDDFVIMSHPPRSVAVDCADFFDDELLIVASSNHVLAKRKTKMSLKALGNDAWIVREQGSGTRYATENIFKQYQFSPKAEMEISDNEAVKQAIIADMGISVVSRESIAIELKNKILSVLPVKRFPVKHTWYLVKNKGKELNPIAEKFYSFVNKADPIFTDVKEAG